MKRYEKPQDAEILCEINDILKDRPTYGYKRITAMINRKRKKKGLDKLNKKRIYRIMDMNNLLLKKVSSRRDHESTGQIITLHSNTRWCSDAFEVQCFNGEKVYVAFSLDCHDREAMSFIARDRQLLAVDIQELMINTVDKRFNKDKAPRRIQWLSDRGAIYRALDTRRLGKRIGLYSCFTAPYSPESNGMAEPFVKTIKRDYVYVSDCFDAKTVMRLLPKWFDDYNKIAPHSGLNMMSPLEYRATIN